MKHVEYVTSENVTMELLKGDDGWYWKYHAPNPDPDPLGPYDTREEAVTDFVDCGVAMDGFEPCEPDAGYDDDEDEDDEDEDEDFFIL